MIKTIFVSITIYTLTQKNYLNIQDKLRFEKAS